MSYPLINRWGLNLFWMRFWYNDKMNVPLNHQTSLFEALTILYLNFGLFIAKNFFVVKYWYLATSVRNFNFANIFTKYFRKVEYRDKDLDDSGSYKLRLHAKNLFFSKVWVLISQGWLVVNVYIFNHVKKKKIITKGRKNYASLSIKHPKFLMNFYKLKLLFLLVFEKQANRALYYSF